MHYQDKQAVGVAHSKVILIGEHAVVYGEPAIAVPFPTLTAKTIIEPVHGQVIFDSKKYSGPLNQVPEKMRGLAHCIEHTLHEFGQEMKNLKIRLESDIPIGSGLGSSAATAIAVVRGLSNYFRIPLSRERLIALSNIAEKYAHGNPSGIDIATVYSDVPIWFKKGQNPKQIFIESPLHLVVGDTGEVGNTRLAVNSILEKRKHDPFNTEKSIHSLGMCVELAKDTLLIGDLVKLGELLNTAQNELKKLGVNDQKIDNLIDTAKTSGALGSKLTGAGRGGCMIALAKDEEHASYLSRKLIQAGAKNAWTFKVNETKREFQNSHVAEGWGENIESNS